MSDEKKQNAEDQVIESKPKTELIDSPLSKGVITGICIYVISYSIFSLFFGNAFGGFISPLLSTVSFFLISRWDRLRESKEVSFQNFKDLIQLPKISIKILLFSIVFIFFVQFILGFSLGLSDCNCENINSYSDVIKLLEESSFLFIVLIISVYVSYIIGGYFSAKLALRKTLSPYVHALLGSFLFYVLSITVTFLIVLFETGQLNSPYDEEASIGANVLFFSQFFLLPLIGAKVAVIRSKPKMIEAAKKLEEEKKASEEFTDLVASEVKRLKPKPTTKQKKNNAQSKTKNKTDS